MRALNLVVSGLLVMALGAGACGYGPEEPSGDGTDVAHPPSGVTDAPPRAGAPHSAPPRPVTPAPAEHPQPPQPEPPPPEAVPTDVTYVPPDPGIISGYLGGALGAARRVQVMSALASVNQWLQTYHTMQDRYPKDMAELEMLYRREGGRLEMPPMHYRYFYWPTHGVVKMVRVDDQRFRDPQGIHTRKEDG